MHLKALLTATYTTITATKAKAITINSTATIKTKGIKAKNLESIEAVCN